MCGIVGILLAPHANDPRRLAAAGAIATTLHHRGPDGSDVWIDRDAGVALGPQLRARSLDPRAPCSPRRAPTFH
jgi:asparagine synthetase B (glutamine-hydrolysing)